MLFYYKKRLYLLIRNTMFFFLLVELDWISIPWFKGKSNLAFDIYTLTTRNTPTGKAK